MDHIRWAMQEFISGSKDVDLGDLMVMISDLDNKEKLLLRGELCELLTQIYH